jgi:hypothetical protein
MRSTTITKQVSNDTTETTVECCECEHRVGFIPFRVLPQYKRSARRKARKRAKKEAKAS